jgi:putative oxidoreductase
MSSQGTTQPRAIGLWGMISRIEALPAAIPQSLPLLALRFAVAVPFFKSGLTKWDGFLQLSAGAQYLFTEEFKLHIFGSEIPYPYPLAFATASGIGEIVLPILLVLGLFTRFAALGIICMTAIIQLTVPDGWANFHLPWAAMALTLLSFGPGRIAVDALIFPRR